jgi:hypothetical protein
VSREKCDAANCGRYGSDHPGILRANLRHEREIFGCWVLFLANANVVSLTNVDVRAADGEANDGLECILDDNSTSNSNGGIVVAIGGGICDGVGVGDLDVDTAGDLDVDLAVEGIPARCTIVDIREGSFDSESGVSLERAFRWRTVFHNDSTLLLISTASPRSGVDAVILDGVRGGSRIRDTALLGSSEHAPDGVGACGTGIEVQISRGSFEGEWQGVDDCDDRLGIGRGRGGSGAWSGGGSGGWGWAQPSVASALLRLRALDTTVGNVDLYSYGTRLHTGATGLVARRPELPFIFAVHWAWVHVALVVRSMVIADLATVLHSSNDGPGAGADTATAKLGAGAVLCAPGSEHAVDWASVGVARLVLAGVTAGNTAVLGFRYNDAGTRLGTGSASGRAGGPGSPGRMDAVDGASESVAADGGSAGGAGNTVVGSRVDHRASLGLAAGTTSLGAGSVSRPAGDLAVDGASKGAAASGGSASGAGSTVVGSRVDYRTSPGLGASAAGLGAGSVARPAGNLAVDGAAEEVAVGSGSASGAGSTTVGSGDDDGARLGLGASAAGLGAAAIARPTGKLAVDGTSESAAASGGSESGATDTAVALGSHDRTSLGLGASAAGLGAGSVARPAGDLAVDGAGLHVAHALFLVGAFVTSVLSSDGNVVGASLHAEATGLGAGGPGVPGVFAVDGARVSVAVLRGRESGAHLAAVSDVGDNGASTLFYAASAKFGASGESSPAGEDAVDRAGLGVAGLVVDVVRALDSSVSNVGGNGTRLSLCPSGARDGARSPSRPLGHDAVDSASEGVAGGRGGEGGAAAATTFLGSYDRTSLGLGASAAGLGAGTVARPAGDLAVDGTSLCVAHTVFSIGAFVTTVLGIDRNDVIAGLLAEATGLGAGSPGVPGVLAVDGARVGVAILLGRLGFAHLAAVSDVGDYRTDTSLDAAAAKFGAGSELGPAGEYTVDRAGLVTAVVGLSVFATHEATIGSRGDHRLGSELGTSATSLGACAPAGPGGKDAVNGASLGLASGGRGQNGAHYTTVLDVGDDGTRFGHGASATGLGAGTVARPARDYTFFRAAESVACVVGCEFRARLAAKLGSGDD